MNGRSSYPSDDLSAYIARLQKEAHDAKIELTKWRVATIASVAMVALYAVRTIVLVVFGV